MENKKDESITIKDKIVLSIFIIGLPILGSHVSDGKAVLFSALAWGIIVVIAIKEVYGSLKKDKLPNNDNSSSKEDVPKRKPTAAIKHYHLKLFAVVLAALVIIVGTFLLLYLFGRLWSSLFGESRIISWFGAALGMPILIVGLGSIYLLNNYFKEHRYAYNDELYYDSKEKAQKMSYNLNLWYQHILDLQPKTQEVKGSLLGRRITDPYFYVKELPNTNNQFGICFRVGNGGEFIKNSLICEIYVAHEDKREEEQIKVADKLQSLKDLGENALDGFKIGTEVAKIIK